MRKFKVLIVEDEAEPLERLLAILQEYSNFLDEVHLKVATTIIEAQRVILESEGFDFSILDINLDEGTCFSLIPKVNKKKLGLLVFNTIDKKGQEYLRDLQILSENYLVLSKPYTKKNVSQLISEVSDRLAYQNDTEEPLQIVLNLGVSGERVVKNANDILYIEGAGKFCNYYILVDGSITSIKNVSGTVDDQLTLLKPIKYFLRVHKSYIVNTSKIVMGRKDNRSGGWLSFIGIEFHSTKNPFVARYSCDHENFQELKSRTGFKKI